MALGDEELGRNGAGGSADGSAQEPGRCALCGRFVGEGRLTRHHLLPRSQARKMKRRKKGREKLKGRDPDRTVDICMPCHRNLHGVLSNADLRRGYDSLEALSAHPDVEKFTDWIKDKPGGTPKGGPRGGPEGTPEGGPPGRDPGWSTRPASDAGRW